MSTVYVLEGWFGDIEWMEGVYADEQVAEADCEALWKTRWSEKGPQYAKGLHKFAVEPYPLLTASATTAPPSPDSVSR